ncbi:General control protein [Lecanora helva]
MPKNSTTHFPNSDFQLFDAPDHDQYRSTPVQPRKQPAPATATSRIALNQSTAQACHNGQQHRQNSTQQSSSSVSTIQNPRVSGIVNGTRSPSTSSSPRYNNSPIAGQQAHFYANSAPSSSAILFQQNHQGRPPIPLFNSTGNAPQADMALTDFDNSDYSLLSSMPDMEGANFFDNPLGSGLTFGSTDDLGSANTNSVQTVSPQDVFLDSNSAPPSGSYPDFTPDTSYSESPGGVYSAETSPQWGYHSISQSLTPLFPDISPEEPVQPTPVSVNIPATNYVAPKMSRNDSSSGQANSRSSNQGRHSFTAGIAPKRRDKPLPAINYDVNDTVAAKRARNTLAARKSRERRVERTDFLVNQVNTLQSALEKSESALGKSEENTAYWKSIALALGHVE